MSVRVVTTLTETKEIILTASQWEHLVETSIKPWTDDMIALDLQYLEGITTRAACSRWGVGNSRACRLIAKHGASE